MSRPKSEDKRNAIMAAATRVIAAQGLSAPTATIAREAGVANGSLFNYFETKADLYNQLYLALKFELVSAPMEALPADADLKSQAFHLWSRWMNLGISFPDKRKAFAQLCVCDEITPDCRASANQATAGMTGFFERIRADGPLSDQPLSFFLAVVEAVAGATMDFMIEHPADAQERCEAGFAALWRAIA